MRSLSISLSKLKRNIVTSLISLGGKRFTICTVFYKGGFENNKKNLNYRIRLTIEGPKFKTIYAQCEIV